MSNTPLNPAAAANVPAINNAPFYQRLADVELPAEPAVWPTIVVAGSLLLIVLLLYFGYRRLKQPRATSPACPPPQQALMRLKAVEQAWSNGEIDQRETAYQLSTLLRLGLNLPQLDHRCPTQLSTQQQEWQQLIAHLDQLRYTPQQIRPLSADTFEQLRQWLNVPQPTAAHESHV